MLASRPFAVCPVAPARPHDCFGVDDALYLNRRAAGRMFDACEAAGLGRYGSALTSDVPLVRDAAVAFVLSGIVVALAARGVAV